MKPRQQIAVQIQGELLVIDFQLFALLHVIDHLLYPPTLLQNMYVEARVLL